MKHWETLVACTDDFGEAVLESEYGGLVWSSEAKVMAPMLPQASNPYYFRADQMPDYRQDRKNFQEFDANCNACRQFVRLKSGLNGGFVPGTCGRLGKLHNQYNVQFMVHPADPMGMKCWEARA